MPALSSARQVPAILQAPLQRSLFRLGSFITLGTRSRLPSGQSLHRARIHLPEPLPLAVKRSLADTVSQYKSIIFGADHDIRIVRGKFID